MVTLEELIHRKNNLNDRLQWAQSTNATITQQELKRELAIIELAIAGIKQKDLEKQ